jgi:sugar/nucleoside kinase (ribokinase family)
MPWDFLVVANPVWETARLVERIPEDPDAQAHPGFRAATAAGHPPVPSDAGRAGVISDPGCPPGGSGIDRPLAAMGDDREAVTDGGGSALNTACALAMAGRRVLAVGRVGDDMPGRSSLEALHARGVETACEILPLRTTKRNTCFVERGTQATAFAVELPARSVPPWEERPDALLEARVLLLDRLAAGAPAWLKARTEALGPGFGVAPSAVSPVNAFVRNSAILSPAAMDRFMAALPHLGYLQVPEEAETETPSGPALAATCGSTARRTLLSPVAPDETPPPRSRVHRSHALPPLAPEEIAAVLAMGVRLLVRTRGARGVVVHTAGQPSVEIAAVATEIVDPTGAGDAFAAGFLCALQEGLDGAASARRGVDWAARACRYLGARAWLDHEPPD